MSDLHQNIKTYIIPNRRMNSYLHICLPKHRYPTKTQKIYVFGYVLSYDTGATIIRDYMTETVYDTWPKTLHRRKKIIHR